MVFVLALSYGIVGGVILLNSIMEADGQPPKVRDLAIMLAVALVWPVLVPALTLLSKEEPVV